MMVTIAECIASVPPSRQAAKPKPQDQIASFYRSWQFQRLRYQALKGKERRCECCGATPADGAKICCDHVKPIRTHWHLRLDPGNLQLLCDSCNRGKGSDDQTNWTEANGRR